jgi:hypothetical protein
MIQIVYVKDDSVRRSAVLQRRRSRRRPTGMGTQASRAANRATRVAALMMCRVGTPYLNEFSSVMTIHTDIQYYCKLYKANGCLVFSSTAEVPCGVSHPQSNTVVRSPLKIENPKIETTCLFVILCMQRREKNGALRSSVISLSASKKNTHSLCWARTHALTHTHARTQFLEFSRNNRVREQHMRTRYRLWVP